MDELTIVDSVFELDIVEMGCETTYSSETMKQLIITWTNIALLFKSMSDFT